MTRNIFSLLTLVGAVLLTSAGVQAGQDAKHPNREEFTAFAINMGKARAGTVDITIDQWSPQGDRDALLKVFFEKGQDAMLRELQKRPRLGFIRLPGTLGWDLHYTAQQPLDDGGRRIVVVTDRPIGFGEARNAGRSMDYPFTMIEIRMKKDGTGQGKLSTGTKIAKSKDGTQLVLETWENEPVRLNEVKQRGSKAARGGTHEN